MASTSPAIPGGDVLPPEPDYHTILDAIAVALSKLPGADGLMIARAHAALERQHSKGFTAGQNLGWRDGYGAGYREGVDDGRREALDRQSSEEAERVLLKAAARTGVPR